MLLLQWFNINNDLPYESTTSILLFATLLKFATNTLALIGTKNERDYLMKNQILHEKVDL